MGWLVILRERSEMDFRIVLIVVIVVFVLILWVGSIFLAVRLGKISKKLKSLADKIKPEERKE